MKIFKSNSCLFFQQDESPNPLASLLFTNAKKEAWEKWGFGWALCKRRSENWNKKDCQELRWNEEVQFTRNDPDEMCVHGFEWESWFNVIFSYIWYKRAKWKKEECCCWTMKKWNNQPHDNETVLLYRLKLFLCSAKGQLSFKISIIYHQLKFVVYVQVYLYTPKSGANTNLEVQTKPPGGAIVTVRPFFKFQILFLAHFETSWLCTEKYILICKLFPIKKFRNVMKYNFEKRLYYSFICLKKNYFSWMELKSCINYIPMFSQTQHLKSWGFF